jgi:two-component system response regulator YesN
MRQFENHIKPFCHISKVPVTFFDTKGEIKWECCSNDKICSFFNTYKDVKSECRKSLLSAARTAIQLGEPYIFVCAKGLVNIAISLIINGECQGTFIAGPIAMGTNRESIIKKILEHTTLNLDIYPELTIFLSQMKMYSPRDVSYLASLFYSIILSSIATNEDYKKINNYYKEQADIGKRIQKYKKQNKRLDYPYQLEEELINMVNIGDSQGAKKILDSLLNEISILESGNLSFIKIRVLGVCAILSRIFSKQDASYQISAQEIENMDMLNNVESYKDLCTLTSKIVDNITTNISSLRYSGDSSIVNKAIHYISENYMNNITLKQIADELHTNHSYLSTLFKKEMGIGFTDYLSNLRIVKSKNLLSGTNLSIVDISLSSGFESQSYFTKIFKKKNGITPNEYRKASHHSLIS